MDIGMDCGGTKTEAVVFDEDRIVEQILEQKPSDKKTVFAIIKKILNKHKNIKFIGIGFPAGIKNGKTKTVTNLKGWDNVDIEKLIKDKFNIRCRVENDANCFALAEANSEDNNKYNTVVGITLGTGLGCGIIINNQVYSGMIGNAGEIHQIPYEGKTLEHFTSKKFFLRNTRRETIDIARKAELGSKKELKLFEEYGKHLAKMLSMIITMLEPDCIIFGGSISKSYHLFEKSMLKELKKHIYEVTYNNIAIKQSTLSCAATRGAVLLKR